MGETRLRDFAYEQNTRILVRVIIHLALELLVICRYVRFSYTKGMMTHSDIGTLGHMQCHPISYS